MTDEELNALLAKKYDDGFKSGRKNIMEVMLKFLRGRMQEKFLEDNIQEASHLRDVIKEFEGFGFHES